MNVLEIEPGCTAYPEHDHAQDGQEEVYVILKGSASLVTSEGEFQVETGMLVRVGPNTKRKFLPGKEGLTILAIGGTPGQAYPKRH
jgi:mannose-6-phosphate isomerase-like protein (cupin superfamily)